MAEPGKLLCLLQDKLGLSEEERQRAARLFDECWQLLRQGTEAETILQVMRLASPQPGTWLAVAPGEAAFGARKSGRP